MEKFIPKEVKPSIHHFILFKRETPFKIVATKR
jgi:hypothetical protein